MKTIIRAMTETLSYADVFDYPMTAREICLWMIGKVYSERAILNTLPCGIQGSREKQLYVLSGRRALAATRRRRMKSSEDKWQRAERIAKILSVIPTILLIGVTGGLSMDNAETDDDIDFFIITRKRCLWISRMLATGILDSLFLRRKPGIADVKNKICLNMFMDEGELPISRKEQNLYGAHEVLQMKPVWERDGAYRRFLYANHWVKKYLPNAWKQKYHGVCVMYYGNKRSAILRSLIHNTCRILQLFEPVAKKLQLWYMKKRITTEIVSDTIIRFHPKHMRECVQKAFEKRMKRFRIPLDKSFFPD